MMGRKVLVGVALAALLGGSAATGARAATYPNVATLRPFSAQTNYMSLPGYLRYLVYQQTGRWLTHVEAVRIVQQQRG